MEKAILITGITQEELSNFLCTAVYGSNIFGIVYKKKDYYGTELEDDDDCREDKWAKLLLSGKPVYVLDYYAEDEDEFYGNLPHKWDEGREAMWYALTLHDILLGMQNAFNKSEWMAKTVLAIGDEENGDYDLNEAEGLLQMIVFGEVIYG